jgi:hypothetical protein
MVPPLEWAYAGSVAKKARTTATPGEMGEGRLIKPNLSYLRKFFCNRNHIIFRKRKKRKREMR